MAPKPARQPVRGQMAGSSSESTDSSHQVIAELQSEIARIKEALNNLATPSNPPAQANPPAFRIEIYTHDGPPRLVVQEGNEAAQVFESRNPPATGGGNGSTQGANSVAIVNDNNGDNLSGPRTQLNAAGEQRSLILSALPGLFTLFDRSSKGAPERFTLLHDFLRKHIDMFALPSETRIIPVPSEERLVDAIPFAMGFDRELPGIPGNWQFLTTGVNSAQWLAARILGGKRGGLPDIASPTAEDVYRWRSTHKSGALARDAKEIRIVWVPGERKAASAAQGNGPDDNDNQNDSNNGRSRDPADPQPPRGYTKQTLNPTNNQEGSTREAGIQNPPRATERPTNPSDNQNISRATDNIDVPGYSGRATEQPTNTSSDQDAPPARNTVRAPTTQNTDRRRLGAEAHEPVPSSSNVNPASAHRSNVPEDNSKKPMGRKKATFVDSWQAQMDLGQREALAGPQADGRRSRRLKEKNNPSPRTKFIQGLREQSDELTKLPDPRKRYDRERAASEPEEEIVIDSDSDDDDVEDDSNDQQHVGRKQPSRKGAKGPIESHTRTRRAHFEDDEMLPDADDDIDRPVPSRDKGKKRKLDNVDQPRPSRDKGKKRKLDDGPTNDRPTKATRRSQPPADDGEPSRRPARDESSEPDKAEEAIKNIRAGTNPPSARSANDPHVGRDNRSDSDDDIYHSASSVGYRADESEESEESQIETPTRPYNSYVPPNEESPGGTSIVVLPNRNPDLERLRAEGAAEALARRSRKATKATKRAKR